MLSTLIVMNQSNIPESDLLTARQAADRLGIKLDTLYAYVSRGRLQSVALPGSRERRYRVEDVEALLATREGERPGRGADSCAAETAPATFKPHNRRISRPAAKSLAALPGIPIRPAPHRPLRCGLVHRTVYSIPRRIGSLCSPWFGAAKPSKPFSVTNLMCLSFLQFQQHPQ